MPAHNAGSTVFAAVESALAQSVQELEVIVVDDGSDEPVSDVLGDVADTRLRLLRHSHRQGVSAARNTALAATRAPLVSILDADDLWEPDYLETVLPEFDDPAVGLVYADAYVVGGPEGRESWIREPARHPIDTFPELAGRNLISPPTVSMRADAVREAGGYATWLYGGSDFYLYLTLARAGWRFAYVNRRLATYHWQAPGTLSYPNAKRARADLKLWAAFALRHPLTPGVKKRLTWHLLRTAAYHLPLAERVASARRGW